MDVCSKFHDNLANSCRDILLKKYKYQPHGGARGKAWGSPKSLRIHPLGTKTSCQPIR